MNASSPKTIYLKDYLEPDFLIHQTELLVQIFDDYTTVTSTLKMSRNTKSSDPRCELVLNGSDLETQSVRVDGVTLDESDFELSPETLTIPNLPDEFELSTVVKINPAENTSLEGFYKSGSMLCTQCEAEGFRKITWYLDRPDVMAKFTTRLEADKSTFPTLLSNGNPIAEGELENNRHFATWEDPFFKPAYLFAMVAGDLVCKSDNYVTVSGRNIDLRLYVEKHNQSKTDFALGALKRSMHWDEEKYGREYDLDIFMIVASDFFNMGAMENKGLNVFNSALVLAKPETTTDNAYERIEGVIGHEYFHNWSGNRVTCRDWFQLSLKEGFTVYRDATFTADLHSAAVKRIDDVTLLRTAQFAEDSGPMSHPVRPASYMEISNFYTLTVYEKGSEVVGMINTFLGDELFRAGSDLYFEKNDGKAATIEDFISAMQEVSGFDFSQFMRWYDQAGTPVVQVKGSYMEEQQEFHLTIKQSCPDTPGQTDKLPFHIPLKMALLNARGAEFAIQLKGDATYNQDTGVLHVTQEEETFVFTGISEKPVPSLLRDFSAPVRLEYDYSEQELAFLMSHDPNGFNRWDAGQRLATNVLNQLINESLSGSDLTSSPLLKESYESVLQDSSIEPAIKVRMLSLPSAAYLSEISETVYIDAIHEAREFLKTYLAKELKELWLNTYLNLNKEKPYQFVHQDVSERSLKNLCLSYLMAIEDEEVLGYCETQYRLANNMTDKYAALTLLSQSDNAEMRQTCLTGFIEEWQDDNQMVEQWLALQGQSIKHDVNYVKDMMGSQHFTIYNPNKVRSLIGGFCMRNPVNFHAEDGSGYQFLTDRILELNKINPQIASRMLTPFTRWRKFEPKRRELMQAQLMKIHSQKDLSKDVFEVVDRSLNS